MQEDQDLLAVNVLDADELFALALRASAQGDDAAALGHLKLALGKNPRHARAHWAIAAEYASLGLPEQAAQHFAQAVALEPAQAVARFQYGLLQLTCGDVEQARAIWAPLDDGPAMEPLRLFKTGLLHMVHDEFDQALAHLQAGLADPDLQAPLRRDMEQVVARLQNSPQAASQAAPAPAPMEGLAQGHLALSAYAAGAPRGPASG